MKQAIFLDTFLGRVGIAQEGEAITNVFLGGSVRPDAFVEGEGWNQDYFTEGERRFPLRADLDEVSSTVPMMIMRACFHIGVLNSAALKALNITRETAPSWRSGGSGRKR